MMASLRAVPPVGVDGKYVRWPLGFDDFEAFRQPVNRFGILVTDPAGNAGHCTTGASHGFCALMISPILQRPTVGLARKGDPPFTPACREILARWVSGSAWPVCGCFAERNPASGACVIAGDLAGGGG